MYWNARARARQSSFVADNRREWIPIVLYERFLFHPENAVILSICRRMGKNTRLSSSRVYVATVECAFHVSLPRVAMISCCYFSYSTRYTTAQRAASVFPTREFSLTARIVLKDESARARARAHRRASRARLRLNAERWKLSEASYQRLFIFKGQQLWPTITATLLPLTWPFFAAISSLRDGAGRENAGGALEFFHGTPPTNSPRYWIMYSGVKQRRWK